MPRTRVEVTLDGETLRRLDRLVGAARYRDRSQAIEAAVREQLARVGRRRLAEECAKVDPATERAWAEEGLSEDPAALPQY